MVTIEQQRAYSVPGFLLKITGVIVLLLSVANAAAAAWGARQSIPLLAFEVVYADGSADVMLADPDHPKTANLTRGRFRISANPVWTRDNRLTFLASQGESSFDLYAFDLHRASITRFSQPGTMHLNTEFAWSPDGRLAYSGTGSGGLNTLYIMDSVGSQPVDVTPGSPFSVQSARWLSETELVFATESRERRFARVAVLNLSDGTQRELSDPFTQSGSPVASAESSTTVFYSYRPTREIEHSWFTMLWSQQRGLTTLIAGDIYQGAHARSISNGQVLLLRTVHGVRDVYLYDLGSEMMTNLTQNGAYERDAAMASDGRIAVYANNSTAQELYVLEPTTRTITAIYSVPDSQGMGHLSWSNGAVQ